MHSQLRGMDNNAIRANLSWKDPVGLVFLLIRCIDL